jgi:pilus assembly protein CpaB
MNAKGFLAAIVAATLGVGLLLLYKKRFEEKALGGRPVPVVVATRDLPLGTAIDPSMLGTRVLPEAYVEARHIRSADAERIIGTPVSMGVKANEAVLWSDLATTSQERRDLSALVKTGRRVLTIRADSSSTFGGLIRPGDSVDVLYTTTREGSAEPVTIALLQNLLVLAIGRDTGSAAGDDQNKGSEVSVSVTVEQAQVLAHAGGSGRMTLILRNPDDINVLDGLPETTARDIIEPARRAHVQHRERPAPPPAGIERVQ